ncbi:predicted protein [Botrytis cinerea T4]|uniref:Uncharacterized protein n=1 Tax=Botryotinia fuckeliana (strain T4) TaxID=999810 RepID=G2XQ72_BOTF4|nr:predicted protein [Botrytis cinerea T4]
MSRIRSEVQTGWKLLKTHLLRLLQEVSPREKVCIQVLTRSYNHWCDGIGPLYS